MYLIVARYSDDPERKRIEYVLEKWKGRLAITKPEGIVAVLNGEEIDEFIEELYSRTSADNVILYRVEKASVDIEKGKRDIKLLLNEKKETVEKLIGFVMARQKAILKPGAGGAFERIYEVSTKKGKAVISVAIREEGQERVDVRLRITGYGEVVDFLHNKLSDELDYLQG